MYNILLSCFLYFTVPSLGRRSYNARQVFPCQCGTRSYKTPHNAKDVTLADIDIIGGIGDSDTAAFAANSRGLDYFTEYWGVSFVTGFSLLFITFYVSISGTDGNWITNPSLANLLRVCNPGLIGGSRGSDSIIFPSGNGRGLNVGVRYHWTNFNCMIFILLFTVETMQVELLSKPENW